MSALADSPSHFQPRVLSIQSHVVHGYVGNKCAVFPLQLLGFEVDPLMTVQFSNHTGYPSWEGDVFSGDQLDRILAGLRTNRLNSYSHVLTGYIGSLSLLKSVVQAVQQLRDQSPIPFTYVCDPVMGDEGKVYVVQELVTAMRDQLVPLASMVTPNDFEARLLTGVDIKDETSALQACEALHEKGPSTVIITSMKGQDQHVLLVGSTRCPQRPGSPSTFVLRIPHIQAYFTGTGDLLTALLLARVHQYPDQVAHAVELAVGALQAVLKETVDEAGPEAMASKERSAQVFSRRELRLVQAQRYLVDPPVIVAAEPLDYREAGGFNDCQLANLLTRGGSISRWAPTANGQAN